MGLLELLCSTNIVTIVSWDFLVECSLRSVVSEIKKGTQYAVRGVLQ